MTLEPLNKHLEPVSLGVRASLGVNILYICPAGQVSTITFGVHRGMSGNKSKVRSFLDSWSLPGICPVSHPCWTDKHNKLPHQHSCNLWWFLGFRNVRVLAAQQGPQNLQFEGMLELVWHIYCLTRNTKTGSFTEKVNDTLLKVLWLCNSWNICGNWIWVHWVYFNSVEFTTNLLAAAHSTMSEAFSHPMLSPEHIKGTCMRMLYGHLFWYAKGFLLTCWKCSHRGVLLGSSLGLK